MRAVLAGLLVGAAGLVTVAQRTALPTESRIRAMARQAAGESAGDPTGLVLALDRQVREAWGDFDTFPLSIVRDEALLVTVTAPYLAFRRSVVDLLRTGRAVDRAVWTGTVDVEVAPRRLGAPDIEAVELTRAGRRVAPFRVALRPMTFSNGSGGEGIIHAGTVHFAPSAFLPGAPVVLSLRPKEHEPVDYTFSDAELDALR
ncbi:MAG TPA: hypothetical protein VM032_08540 [Vicinamibacterales bacterium]|nr:hypothetical protein [Vicinamibacterales bacterium]